MLRDIITIVWFLYQVLMNQVLKEDFICTHIEHIYSLCFPLL